MSWSDFIKYFNGVDVCYHESDLSSLSLNIYESFNICGPFIGCLIGLYSNLIFSLYLISYSFKLIY